MCIRDRSTGGDLVRNYLYKINPNFGSCLHGDRPSQRGNRESLCRWIASCVDHRTLAWGSYSKMCTLYQFRYFQNGEPDRDGLVGGYSLFCGANHDQIVVDNFTLSKCDLADGLCQFGWIANQRWCGGELAPLFCRMLRWLAILANLIQIPIGRLFVSWYSGQSMVWANDFDEMPKCGGFLWRSGHGSHKIADCDNDSRSWFYQTDWVWVSWSVSIRYPWISWRMDWAFPHRLSCAREPLGSHYALDVNGLGR